MTEPNFLIIGAAKAGTTSLYHYLLQHPDIYFSANKEPHFFALENSPPDYRGPGDRFGMRCRVTDWHQYLKLFYDAGDARAIGEASTLYLYHPEAAKNIFHHLPNIKMIAILRNPVEAAYSAFCHMTREGREPCIDLMEALHQEPKRITENWAPLWHYTEQWNYLQQLQRFDRLFPANALKIFLYNELQDEPEKVLSQCCRFLRVDDGFDFDMSQRHNQGGVPHSALLHRLLTTGGGLKRTLASILPMQMKDRLKHGLINANLNRDRMPPLTDEARNFLHARFDIQIPQLEARLGRSLAHWSQTT